jgi:hypothetical protein
MEDSRAKERTGKFIEMPEQEGKIKCERFMVKLRKKHKKRIFQNKRNATAKTSDCLTNKEKEFLKTNVIGDEVLGFQNTIDALKSLGTDEIEELKQIDMLLTLLSEYANSLIENKSILSDLFSKVTFIELVAFFVALIKKVGKKVHQNMFQSIFRKIIEILIQICCYDFEQGENTHGYFDQLFYAENFMVDVNTVLNKIFQALQDTDRTLVQKENGLGKSYCY